MLEKPKRGPITEVEKYARIWKEDIFRLIKEHSHFIAEFLRPQTANQAYQNARKAPQSPYKLMKETCPTVLYQLVKRMLNEGLIRSNLLKKPRIRAGQLASHTANRTETHYRLTPQVIAKDKGITFTQQEIEWVAYLLDGMSDDMTATFHATPKNGIIDAINTVLLNYLTQLILTQIEGRRLFYEPTLLGFEVQDSILTITEKSERLIKDSVKGWDTKEVMYSVFSKISPSSTKKAIFSLVSIVIFDLTGIKKFPERSIQLIHDERSTLKYRDAVRSTPSIKTIFNLIWNRPKYKHHLSWAQKKHIQELRQIMQFFS